MDLIDAPKKYIFIDTKNQKYRRPREYIIAAAIQGAVEPTGFLAAIQKKPQPSFFEKIKLHVGLTPKPPQLKINQTKQLADFIMKSGWWDSRRDNYALTPTGKLCIIDTQIQTFTPEDKLARKEAAIKGLEVLLRKDQVHYLDKESQKYVRDRIKKEQASLEVDRWFAQELAQEKNKKSTTKQTTQIQHDLHWPSL